MNKLLSCVIFFTVSLGFSFSAAAARDTLIGSGGLGNPQLNYLAPNCAWNSQTYATSLGAYTTNNLLCSGVLIATTNYYGIGNAGTAPVNTFASGYYALKRDGEIGAIGYDWAIYKRNP